MDGVAPASTLLVFSGLAGPKWDAEIQVDTAASS
jgi:hypothetical protein